MPWAGNVWLPTLHLPPLPPVIQVSPSPPSLSPPRIAVPTTTLPACSKYVFGFSTGHVGTHTFCNPHSYVSGRASVESVGFTFERGVMHTSEYDNVTADAEEQHVRGTYLPLLRQQSWSSDSQHRKHPLATCVDLSHPNLYFYEGLLRVLRPAAALAFVRIRRPEVEVARSFVAESSREFLHLGFGYRPDINPSRVVLSLPTTTFYALNPFQQGLWSVDETEARWQLLEGRLRAEVADRITPAVEVLDVFWSKEVPGSMERAVHKVASFLGLKPAAGKLADEGHHFAGFKATKFGQRLQSETERLEACLFHAYHELMTACADRAYVAMFGNRSLPALPAAGCLAYNITLRADADGAADGGVSAGMGTGTGMGMGMGTGTGMGAHAHVHERTPDEEAYDACEAALWQLAPRGEKLANPWEVIQGDHNDRWRRTAMLLGDLQTLAAALLVPFGALGLFCFIGRASEYSRVERADGVTSL